MQKEVISNRQGIAIMVMFIMGSILILGVGSGAKQDVWLAIIIALAFVVPVISIYARILVLFPGKNLYEILNTVFGRFFGRIIANWDNLRPVLYDGIGPVLDNAFEIFSFPFAETVLFTAIFSLEKGRNNPYKIYYLSAAAGTFFILLVSIRNVLALGADFIDQLYFSSYTVVSLVSIGDFLQRIEATVAVAFLFAGFVKISACLFAASKGTGYLFNIEDHRQITAPIGLFMMIMSCLIYRSIMEMQEWAFDVYKYYAFPFQVILPVFIWIAAEIKAKVNLDVKVNLNYNYFSTEENLWTGNISRLMK